MDVSFIIVMTSLNISQPRNQCQTSVVELSPQVLDMKPPPLLPVVDHIARHGIPQYALQNLARLTNNARSTRAAAYFQASTSLPVLQVIALDLFVTLTVFACTYTGMKMMSYVLGHTFLAQSRKTRIHCTANEYYSSGEFEQNDLVLGLEANDTLFTPRTNSYKDAHTISLDTLLPGGPSVTDALMMPPMTELDNQPFSTDNTYDLLTSEPDMAPVPDLTQFPILSPSPTPAYVALPMLAAAISRDAPTFISLAPASVLSRPRNLAMDPIRAGFSSDAAHKVSDTVDTLSAGEGVKAPLVRAKDPTEEHALRPLQADVLQALQEPPLATAEPLDQLSTDASASFITPTTGVPNATASTQLPPLRRPSSWTPVLDEFATNAHTATSDSSLMNTKVDPAVPVTRAISPTIIAVAVSKDDTSPAASSYDFAAACCHDFGHAASDSELDLPIFHGRLEPGCSPAGGARITAAG
ncbi:hypothetical protein BD626DRAFT_534406 [Schizophyllum amplum]|uniref:Uncharacterized protein n=1 Tax=Schizophyllum amplum TaxID=97359 RepID=A0A550CU39_9AGAR|nr:hypothetical protein BD626DRAFT_534406 [Auriculariopsis ampla]